MPNIKRSGTSSGGRKGKPGTSNTKAKSKGAARSIKLGAGHGGKNC
jgi:hypothetical protein